MNPIPGGEIKRKFRLSGTNVFMSTAAVSFARYLLDHEAKRPELGVEFCHLMLQLAFAAKIIAREITRAALINRLGLVGTQNATGDAQKILDVFTNDTMTRTFARTGLVAEIISEEMVEPKRVPGGANAHFILCTDPLDGSANTDANAAVGTIFAVYRPSRAFGEATGFAGAALNRWRRVT
jgi:fructose-1,6-bisphosphatase I